MVHCCLDEKNFGGISEIALLRGMGELWFKGAAAQAVKNMSVSSL